MNELYLEAQQNLDHRNVKKRLQYQQMYELYLPQARHLLLDPARRAEYDRYLQAYHSGHLPPPAPVPEEDEGETSTDVSTGTSSSDVAFTFDDAELAEAQEPVDPEKQAEEREHLWARWKTGLEHVLVDDGSGSAGDTPAEYDSAGYDDTGYETAEYDNADYANAGYNAESAGTGYQTDYATEAQPDGAGYDYSTAPAEAAPASRRPAPGTPASPRPAGTRRTAAADPTAIDLSDPEKVKEIEHQREVRRYALIKQAAQSAGMVWGWGTGAGFFFAACVIFYFLDNYLTSTRNHPIDRSIFNALCLIGITLLSVFVGWTASSSARQRVIDELSHLALPDLVRRTRGK
jgi:curved DNA-binding protein CbpA